MYSKTAYLCGVPSILHFMISPHCIPAFIAGDSSCVRPRKVPDQFPVFYIVPELSHCSINTCISDCFFVSQMFYQRKNLRNGSFMNIISVIFILLQYHTCHISVRSSSTPLPSSFPAHPEANIIPAVSATDSFQKRSDHSINHRITVTGRNFR